MHGRTRAHASASLRQRYCGIGAAVTAMAATRFILVSFITSFIMET